MEIHTLMLGNHVAFEIELLLVVNESQIPL